VLDPGEKKANPKKFGSFDSLPEAVAMIFATEYIANKWPVGFTGGVREGINCKRSLALAVSRTPNAVATPG